MYDFTHGEFAENMTRVENLMGAYQELDSHDIGTTQMRKDVLRASAVFLHSTLEEVVRNLFLFCLPHCDPKSLDKIPFVGHEATHRPKEILLGQLKAYSGRIVENVIVESINAYVDSMNINGTDQLADCLKIAEIEVEPLRKYFANLASLMKRRHQIVHQMDRTSSPSGADISIADIDVATIRVWKESLESFAECLMKIVGTNTRWVVQQSSEINDAKY
jgi:hypothetical protein